MKSAPNGVPTVQEFHVFTPDDLGGVGGDEATCLLLHL